MAMQWSIQKSRCNGHSDLGCQRKSACVYAQGLCMYQGGEDAGACECSYSLAQGINTVNNPRAIKVTRCDAQCLQFIHREHHLKSLEAPTHQHTHITHIDRRPELHFPKLQSGVAAIGSRAVWLASPVPPKASPAARAVSHAPQNHPPPRPHRWWRHP